MRRNQSLIILAALTLSVTQASAAVRTYFSPELDGYRASACLADGQTCGKPAADAWCKANGWTSALIFQRDSQPQTTRLIDSGDLCSGPACASFHQIKCYTPETASSGDVGNGG